MKPVSLSVVLVMFAASAAMAQTADVTLSVDDPDAPLIEQAVPEGAGDPNSMPSMQAPADAPVAPELVKVPDAPAVAEEVPAPAPVAEVPAAAPRTLPKPGRTRATPPEPRDIPLIETQNEVTAAPDVAYVTGGIGQDEQEQIQTAKADYNLYVMSASTSGAFVGDSRVVITKNGKEPQPMLSVVAGPLLYVKLPEGAYTLQATLGEQVKKQSFTIGKTGSKHVHLGWKVN